MKLYMMLQPAFRGFPKTIFLFLLLCALFILGGCSRQAPGAEDHIIQGDAGRSLAEQMVPYVQKIMEQRSIPGVTIGVVKDGQIIYAQGFGSASLELGSSVTIQTAFHMASVSKTFVATAIMQLAEQGKIDLDATVTTYLPYFKMKGDAYKRITIRQMLGHISGMPNSNDYEWDKPQYDDGAIERFVRGLANEQMELQPGEKFRYSNVAFEVLGDVIAKTSGISFADYEKKFVLEPSGMSTATFLKPDSLPGGWAAPHAVGLKAFEIDVYPYNRRHAPSSTLHASCLDMCSWMLINLNRGSNDGHRILSTSSYDTLWQASVPVNDGQHSYSHIGLSWFVGAGEEPMRVGHGGSDEGFHTNVVLVPDQSIGVVVMANSMPAPVEEISDACLTILSGGVPESPKPLATGEVWRVLEDRGLDAAVARWDDLKENHTDEYDFGLTQFYAVYFTAKFARGDQATSIARFSKAALSREETEALSGILEYLLGGNPDNASAKSALAILRGDDKQ